MAWTGPGTLGFMGGVCGPSSFYTVNMDGSNLLHLWDFEWSLVAHPSPDGSSFAFTLPTESRQPSVTTIVDADTGATREFVTGGVFLSFFPHGQPWSDDGRYLALAKPPGKGGLCEGSEPQTFELIRHP